ncbi:MAG: methyl-accepting chemotaxis protein [Myxococcaceae bacterium]|jgi:methyl-accepting chemotaxis protein|nr:methyl-accepting chemotaxis protein [Myxococcaceae bacterium]
MSSGPHHEALVLSLEQLGQLSQTVSGHATSALAVASQVQTTVDQVATVSGTVASAATSITERVDQSTRLASEAAKRAQDATTAMRALAEASRAIEQITRSIERISEQINVLALNATIEAARAGALGTGFAVVAREVKSLALEARKATRDIDARVSTVFSEVERSVSAVGAVEQVIVQVSALCGAIREAAGQQAAQLAEVAQHTSLASQGLKAVTGEVERVAELSMDEGAVLDRVKTQVSEPLGTGGPSGSPRAAAA